MPYHDVQAPNVPYCNAQSPNAPYRDAQTPSVRYNDDHGSECDCLRSPEATVMWAVFLSTMEYRMLYQTCYNKPVTPDVL